MFGSTLAARQIRGKARKCKRAEQKWERLATFQFPQLECAARQHPNTEHGNPSSKAGKLIKSAIHYQWLIICSGGTSPPRTRRSSRLSSVTWTLTCTFTYTSPSYTAGIDTCTLDWSLPRTGKASLLFENPLCSTRPDFGTYFKPTLNLLWHFYWNQAKPI